MPDLGNHQLQTTGAVRICEVVRCYETLERTKISSKLYGGGYLIQTVGTPSRILHLTLRAWSDAERDAVNEAEADCTPVDVKNGSTLTRGILMDEPAWSVVVDGGIYETTVNLAVIT